MKISNKNINKYLFLLPVLLGLIVYANSITAPFQYDDYDTIMQNKDIRILKDLKSVFMHSLFRPVLFLTFAINYSISGLNPISYHIVNLILHLINIILVFFLIRRISSSFINAQQSEAVALLTSLIFAVHPIGTEAITYISSRSSVLATTFFLSSFLLYLVSIKYSTVSKRMTFYAISLILFILGILSKEIILTLPIMFVLWDIFHFNIGFRETLKRIFSTHLPIAILIVIGFIVRIYFFFAYEKIGGVLPRTIYENLLTQSEVIIKYIRLLILPFGQNLIHNYPTVRSILNFYTILCIFTIILIIRFAITNRKSLPIISFGILWFFITLLPSSSFVPFQEAMTEKHLYLPMIGLFISISGTILLITEKIPQHTRKIKHIIGITIIILSVLTIYRNYIWSDSIRLWEDITSKTPDSWATHYACGDAYRKQAEEDIAASYRSYQLGDQGKSQELLNRYIEYISKAIIHYTQSVLYRPSYIDALLNTGICYGMLAQVTRSEKDISESERFFKIVRELEHDNTKALNNLANLYIIRGNPDAAIRLYNEVLDKDPKNINALTNISQIYINVLKDYSKSREMLQRLLEELKYYREFEKAREIENILKGLPQ